MNVVTGSNVTCQLELRSDVDRNLGAAEICTYCHAHNLPMSCCRCKLVFENILANILSEIFVLHQCVIRVIVSGEISLLLEKYLLCVSLMKHLLNITTSSV